MKTHLLIIIFISLFSFSAEAKIFMPLAGGDSDFEQTEDATHIPAMILVEEEDIDSVIAELEEQGVTVLRHRGNILLTFIPIDREGTEKTFISGENDRQNDFTQNSEKAIRKKLRKISGIDKIVISKPRHNSGAMDIARRFNNAQYIADGIGLPHPYTGKGVVVGVCDIGIDTRHPNFMTADLNECRIRRVAHYEELQGRRTLYTTPEEIYNWQTDDSEDWHATHVAGIAAGAYKQSNYYGLAPDADIVFSGSQLSDVGLLAGVEDIIDYAKEVGKPAVINLSMGNYTGPHDGTSLFSRYLDMCADDAIICLSAGNEGIGGEPRSMSFDFTESQKEFRVCPNNWDGLDNKGLAEVWSEDETPVNLTFFWKSTKGFDDYEPVAADDFEEVEWSISVDLEAEDYDSEFASHHTGGYVKITAGISPLNGRYCATLEFDLHSDLHQEGKDWAEYWAGIKVEGEPGTHVDVFCGGGSFLRGVAGNPSPDNAMCISDLATGFRTISVGSMNSTEYEGGDMGMVSRFSGYGTLNDGRKLPLTVAPGAYVTSSISSAYLDTHPDFIQHTDYRSEFAGRPYYWIGTNGTSMSCPFVVGAIATWLQAYPQLTADDAIEIISKTNQKNGYPDPDNPRHGQGWFNAYAGLQAVLGMASVNTGSIDSNEPLLRLEGKQIFIANPTGRILEVNVYSPAGMLVDKVSFSDTLGQYDLSPLPSGIYLVNADGYTLKIAI